MSQVILVDEHDVPQGTLEKMAAHEQGLLHRAFSVFIFNDLGEMLLQQRADDKYHSAGLWTNACCSHPWPGENTADAAARRLQEEMGFVTLLSKAFQFVYKCSFENGLYEHEFDHVFTGVFSGEILPDINEVKAWKYVSLADISVDIDRSPQHYTEWFKIAFPQLLRYLAAQKL